MILFIAMSVVSITALIIFQREIRHVAKTQIHILGRENEEIIYSRRLRAALFLYSIVMVGLVLSASMLFLFP